MKTKFYYTLGRISEQHDKINIFVQADAHIGTHVEESSSFSLSVPTLNPIMKNHEESK
jgi:hypothetical protein